MRHRDSSSFFFFNDTATTEIYTLSLHDALPISARAASSRARRHESPPRSPGRRSEEHTSELQSPLKLVCRLLLEKKKRFILCFFERNIYRKKIDVHIFNVSL